MYVEAQLLIFREPLAICFARFWWTSVSYFNQSMLVAFILMIRSTWPGMERASFGKALRCSAGYLHRGQGCGLGSEGGIQTPQMTPVVR